MHARNDKTRQKDSCRRGTRVCVVVVATAIGLAAGAMSADLVCRPPAVPQVGDIIAFDLGKSPSYGNGEGRIAVERQGQDGCALDAEAMRQTGGSLIVEERLTGQNPAVRVHWAGLRTAGDQGNCGADADLIVRSGDMAILAAAAGGYGVIKPPAPPPFSLPFFLDASVFP